MSQIQPIDGAYFTTWYFWVSLVISFVVASIAVYWNGRDERKGRYDRRWRR